MLAGTVPQKLQDEHSGGSQLHFLPFWIFFNLGKQRVELGVLWTKFPLLEVWWDAFFVPQPINKKDKDAREQP